MGLLSSKVIRRASIIYEAQFIIRNREKTNNQSRQENKEITSKSNLRELTTLTITFKYKIGVKTIVNRHKHDSKSYLENGGGFACNEYIRDIINIINLIIAIR